MKLLLDLQALQSDSAGRGIGRYSSDLAEAMIAAAPQDVDIHVLFNGALATDFEALTDRYRRELGADRVHVFRSLTATHGLDATNAARERGARVVREAVIAGLELDAVHVASPFEGYGDSSITGRTALTEPLVCGATVYDFIPYEQSESFLALEPYRSWYLQRLSWLREQDLFLAISEHTRRRAVEALGVPAERTVNIGADASPVFRRLDLPPLERQALLKRYGLDKPFIMHTGVLDARKNVEGLVRAYAELHPDLRDQVVLALAAKTTPDQRERLKALAASLGLPDTAIRFLGYVPDEDLAKLYNVCRVFVFPSLAEGFGLPLLEAMRCGAVSIGADNTSLPEVLGDKRLMFNGERTQEIADRLRQALTDDDFRGWAQGYGLERAKRFSWRRSAELALEAFRSQTRERRPTARRQSDEHAPPLLDAALAELVQLRRQDDIDDSALAESANALAANLLPPADARLLVDVTELAQRDAKSGVQRVVRGVLSWIFELSPIPVELIRFDKGPPMFARKLQQRFDAKADPDAPEGAVVYGPDDVVLGLDLNILLPDSTLAALDQARRLGARVAFVVYDALPLLRPDCFNEGLNPVFRLWLRSIAEVSDALACISDAVAAEVQDQLDEFRPKRSKPLAVNYFHLGSDLQGTSPTRGRTAEDDRRLARLAGRDYALTVGTIEPRKGYDQLLDAFDQLWSEGAELHLVIVGKRGWLADATVRRLEKHPQLEQRLIWFETATDELLDELFGGAKLAVMPTEGEGFGLPLVEAAGHGTPILARDLPVLREVGRDGAAYFSGESGEALAEAIARWLEDDASGLTPSPEKAEATTWRESTRQLLDAVLGDKATRTWDSSRPRRWHAIGSAVQTQSGVKSKGRIETTGFPGYLIYGPYDRLPAGKHELTIEFELLDYPGVTNVSLDVRDADADAIVFDRWLYLDDGALHERRTVSVTFECGAVDRFEVRLFVNPEVRMRVYGYTLQPVSAGAVR